MPVKSKKQFKFIQALIHGDLKKKPKGFSKKEAKEFVDTTPNYKKLPETVKKKKK